MASGSKPLALLLPLCWICWSFTSAAQSLPRLTGFLLGVEPQRQMALRLLAWRPDGLGFQPVDSVALTTDGPLELHGRTPGLFQLALPPYSQTELVLMAGEVPHFAATVKQLARQGVYLENSPENNAYFDVLNLVQHYDTLIGRVHVQLAAGSADSSQVAGSIRLLERYHRNLNIQLRERQSKYPGTYAVSVLVPLALLPERPAAEAGRPGYLPWLRTHYLDTFPFTTDAPLRHWLGAARVAYFLNQLGPLGEGGKPAAADALLAHRQGHDLVNAWLYRVLVAEATRQDDDALAQHLRVDYPPDACAPGLPEALLTQLNRMAELAPGQPLPALTARDSVGRTVDLQSVIKRQRATIIVAWVSWCHTCEQEIPKLAAAYPDLKRRGIEVVTISLDEQRTPWVTALRRQRPPWTWSLAELIPLRESQTAHRLHVRLTPKILVVGQDGRLIGRYASVQGLLHGHDF